MSDKSERSGRNVPAERQMPRDTNCPSVVQTDRVPRASTPRRFAFSRLLLFLCWNSLPRSGWLTVNGRQTKQKKAVLFLMKGSAVEKRVEAEKLHTSCRIFLGKHFVTMKTCVFSRGPNSRGQFHGDKSLSVSSRTYDGSVLVLVQSLFKKCRLHLFSNSLHVSFFLNIPTHIVPRTCYRGIIVL